MSAVVCELLRLGALRHGLAHLADACAVTPTPALNRIGWTPLLTSLVRDSKYRFFSKPTDWQSAQVAAGCHASAVVARQPAACVPQPSNLRPDALIAAVAPHHSPPLSSFSPLALLS